MAGASMLINGFWTPEGENLMNGLDGFKKEFPDLFKKVTK